MNSRARAAHSAYYINNESLNIESMTNDNTTQENKNTINDNPSHDNESVHMIPSSLLTCKTIHNHESRRLMKVLFDSGGSHTIND